MELGTWKVNHLGKLTPYSKTDEAENPCQGQTLAYDKHAEITDIF
jgi:hypothetical protein